MGMAAIEAFNAKDGGVTVGYQNELISRGKAGQLAFGLFRAQKRSTRAKVYRGKFRGNSYDGKNEALKFVDSLLLLSGSSLDSAVSDWGWKRDHRQAMHDQVLYVDLKDFGQCSFHSAQAMSGRHYRGNWDSSKASVDVVLAYCDSVTKNLDVVPLDETDCFPFGKNVGKMFCDLERDYFQWLLQWDGLSHWSAIRSVVQSLAS
jgi:hypothetical protein